MKTQHIHSIVGAVIAITLSCASGAAENSAGALNAQEILSQVIGNTIVYEDDANDRVEEYLAKDGAVHGKSRKHGSYVTEWQIRFGHYLCLVSKDPTQSGCVQVLVHGGSKIEFRLDIGETEGPFALLAGNPSHL